MFEGNSPEGVREGYCLPSNPAGLVGYVEVHGPSSISGWCIDKGVAPSEHRPMQLTIRCGNITLRKIRADLRRQDIEFGHKVLRSGFMLSLSDELLDLLPQGSLLTVSTEEGVELPYLNAEGERFIGKASDGGLALQERFSQGYVIDKWGALKLPFRAMGNERAQYAQAMSEAAEHFATRYGIVLFPHYGTLLGFARGGAFLEHDDDVDMSFVMNANYIEQVAERFIEIAEDLADQGHHVSLVSPGQMHFRLKDRPWPGVDIFASWLTDSNLFYTYFGVGGTLRSPVRYCQKEMEGVRVVVPENYGEILSLTYGESWRTPDQNFQWEIPEHLEGKMDALKALGRGRTFTRG